MPDSQTFNCTASYKNLSYYQQVWKGYTYLWKESGEILGHQLIFDPIQDTFIKLGFEKIIQYGHNPEEINFEVEGGPHQWVHNIIGDSASHGLGGFALEFVIHAGVKTAATLAFPIAYPIYINPPIYTNYIPGTVKSFISDSTKSMIKLFGICPLELINSFKIFPDSIFGTDNILSNSIEYITLREHHHKDRADDYDLEQFMTNYDIWMETVDATLHAYDDISIIYNNKHLAGMSTKIMIWMDAKLNMYFNAEREREHHDQKVQNLRGSIPKLNSHEKHYNIVEDFLYTAKLYLDQQIINLSINKLASFAIQKYMAIYYPTESHTTEATNQNEHILISEDHNHHPINQVLKEKSTDHIVKIKSLTHDEWSFASLNDENKYNFASIGNTLHGDKTPVMEYQTFSTSSSAETNPIFGNKTPKPIHLDLENEEVILCGNSGSGTTPSWGQFATRVIETITPTRSCSCCKKMGYHSTPNLQFPEKMEGVFKGSKTFQEGLSEITKGSLFASSEENLPHLLGEVSNNALSEYETNMNST